MSGSMQTIRFRFWLWLIRIVGVIVPRRLRADWRQEWEAELHHREELLAEWDRLDWQYKLNLFRRSTSAFWDALWLQPKRMEDEMFQDLRFGIRMLLKNPSFSLIAVFTLALGIGANTAVFTLINAILLRTLPVESPYKLVALDARIGGNPGYISFPMYRDLRARQEVFTDILASAGGNSVRLTIPNGTGTIEMENVHESLVSASYWNVLGVQPAIGRFFTEEEDRDPNSSETAGSVAVLSYSFWERQFRPRSCRAWSQGATQPQCLPIDRGCSARLFRRERRQRTRSLGSIDSFFIPQHARESPWSVHGSPGQAQTRREPRAGPNRHDPPLPAVGSS
jgi:MacB-like protein